MTVKIKTVIFNHNQRESVDQLYLQLHDTFDTAVLDSGSDDDQISEFTTYECDNLYWTGCWNEAWRIFQKDFDVIWGIGGDCRLLSPPEAYREAIQTVYPFGTWSPVISGTATEYMKPDLAAGRILSVHFLEGVAFAVTKELWQMCGPLPADNFIGWGYDLLCCFRSRQSGQKNILDGRVELQHPTSSQYDFEQARLLMNKGLELALGPDWCDIMDWWWGRRITFPSNAVSEVKLNGATKSFDIPFYRK